jgi:hypothetical protein
MISLGRFSSLDSLLQATKIVAAVVAANKRAGITFFMIFPDDQDKEIKFCGKFK